MRRLTLRPKFDHLGNAETLAFAQDAASTALRDVVASYGTSSQLANVARQADRAVSRLRWELDRTRRMETGAGFDDAEERRP